MSRKQCKRTHYIAQPGTSLLDVARFNASKLTAEEIGEQMAPVYEAMNRLTQGDWDAHLNWNPMFECLNRIEAMLQIKKMPDHGLIDSAKTVFVTCLNRKRDTGATAFRASELAAMREIVSVYRDLLGEITHADFKRTTALVKANVTRIVRQKTKPASVRQIGDCIIQLKGVA